MIYYDKPYLHIDYNQGLNCTVNTWRGYFLSSEYREAMNKCIEAILYTGATSMIVNIQSIRTEDVQDVHWTNTDWFPRMVGTEIGKMAIIASKEIFHQVQHKEMQVSVGDKVLYGRYFDTLETAQQWIAWR